MAQQGIPVVDLREFKDAPDGRARFVDHIGAAMADTGFFVLEGHGIPDELIERAYALAESLFLRTEAEKQGYERRELHGQRGYTAFGREHAKDADAPDLKEFWHVGQELAPDHPLAEVYPANIWPTEVPEFKAVYSSLFRRLDACAGDLLEACALAIGEPTERFSSLAKDGNSILRVIHYPPIGLDAHPKSIRAAAHEDINLITLLPAATAGGLELLERNGSWRPVEATKGQIIVDAGDMLQNITNGLFKSTTHRVINPGNSRDRRFSLPFFVHPRSEVDLTPLPSCVALTGGKVVYPPITAGDYLQQRLREIGLK
ncbi:MAG: isopenicillin N synthase family oxygenase [Proteobacteria bacterium]|nr:isopenicillin N synthase family oxygenase [Pseudomonadota bacterium]